MEYLITLFLAHNAIGSVPAPILAAEVLEVAEVYEVEPVLLAQIIVVESRGKPGAYNRKTHDYGLMQINAKTAKAYGIGSTCLHDWRCNLRAGALVLSQLPRACRYNVGTAPFSNKHILNNCLRYERKLASIN